MFQITSVDQLLQPVQKTNKAMPPCFADIICSMKTAHKTKLHKEKNPTKHNKNCQTKTVKTIGLEVYA
jgi:predicted protein tyrosine phosphatase